MGVHPMEIMKGLVPKGTGKNSINDVHCDKNISIKTWADCFEGMFRVNCRDKYLIISLEIKGNYSKINKDEWMQITTTGVYGWKHLLAPWPRSLVSCYNQMSSVNVCVAKFMSETIKEDSSALGSFFFSWNHHFFLSSFRTQWPLHYQEPPLVDAIAWSMIMVSDYDLHGLW